MKRVDQALNAIVAAPQSYPVVYRNLRRAVVRQFPFAIFYEAIGNEIIVFAFNTHDVILEDWSLDCDGPCLNRIALSPHKERSAPEAATKVL